MGSEQRNAVIAVILSGLILFGWNYYFAPKTTPSQVAPTGTISNPDHAPQPITTQVNQPPTASAPVEPVLGEEFIISGAGAAVTFANDLSFITVSHQQTGHTFSEIVGPTPAFRVEFDFGAGFQVVRFSKISENKFQNVDHNLTLDTSFSEKGIAQFNITSPNAFKYRFLYKSEPKKLENGQERVFAYYTDELNRHTIGEEEAGDRGIKWTGIDFDYHIFANYFDQPQNLIFKAAADNTFTAYSNKSTNQVAFNTVFAKKEYNFLASLGHNMNNSVDFGIWGFFAVWILKGLQFFYKFIPNYGVSIILLTLLIRLITFPLQYKSFVSMKKLQVIQPELNKIREKFKDDPQRMQKESMELFRKSGANPIGGCLPLLLQMPVFFAFYKVLHAAVELVDAPFVGWIKDLSNKDPFFVLPVLMTAAMFLQQKMTPNTITDPVQKKVMMFMPLIFGVIMKDLPSGLSLYIFVSTLFGIIQQTMVFNSKSKSDPVVV